MTTKDFISLFQTPLWKYMQDLIVIAIFLALASTGVTEAIKRALLVFFKKKSKIKEIKEDFIHQKCDSKLIWAVNLFISILISCIFILAFRQEKLFVYNIWFMIFVSIITWAISTLLYENILKLIIDGVKYIHLKIQNRIIDQEIEVATSLETKIKAKELLINIIKKTGIHED